MAGKPSNGLQSVNIARRIDPYNEYYYLFLKGLSEFGREEYQSAEKSFEQALELNPDLWSSGDGYGCAFTPIPPLLAVYYYLGKTEAIRSLLGKTKYGCPINTAMLSWPYKESVDINRLSEGLRGAGMPLLHLRYDN